MMRESALVLVGRYRSPYTRRVAVALKMLGFNYSLRAKTAWQDFEEVSRLNPIGRVPVLILENGEALFESQVILDYLDGRVGLRCVLLPCHGAKRRRVQRLASLALGVIDKGRELLFESTLRPEATRYRPYIERWEAQIRSVARALDGLAETPWAANGCISQADVTIGVMIDFIRLHHPHLLEQGAYPRLDELISAYHRLPAFAETMPEPA